MPPDYHIADDTELRDRVRDVTFYGDTAQEIPQTDLEGIVNNAKLRLDTQTGLSDFYADTGAMLAILYTTAIEAKLAIENYSVTRWDEGAGEIDVSGAGEADQAQFDRWADHVATGLAKTSAASDPMDSGTNVLSNSYVG